MEKNNVKVEHIIPLMIAGDINYFGLPIGWTIYPVTYKGEQYVVEIKNDIKSIEYNLYKHMVYIFKYNSRKNLFNKHKGKEVFCKEVTALRINEHDFIDTGKLLDKDVAQYLPAIVKNIFSLYEMEQQLKKSSSKILENIQWDGIVD